LTANNVLGYVFGTLPCPPTTIENGGATVENPAFLVWKRLDNYVLLALFGTCDHEAQIVVSSATSSADAISRLTKVYTNRSRIWILSLKECISLHLVSE